ncbi:orotate phosphoribosyltransferase [Botrimarina hoheduenensis]|uniref:Orotate phosphoribosyltransferase n=1 Tax=Botrimarina hoheduenensis TaxID=2528000 RepID=A0A5C5W898_9BACT|nr:orotate phosphoribosyltransferase [Botrimarina hoheduenensis]TWT46405.1 Orotate phosphoribosyltransferase [Botrimarina hoheduenensis]
MYDRDALAKLLRNNALEFGDFTLASGKQASYYLDCRRVTLDARGARLIGEGMINLIGELRLKMGQGPKLVGGMAVGADPITAAILTTAGIKGYPLRGVIVRKEPKAHGKGQQVEGPFSPGESIVIVEDVVTTGASSLKAIELCEAEGLKVERVLAIVDRLEGGRAAFAAKGYELTTLFTVEDLGVQLD